MITFLKLARGPPSYIKTSWWWNVWAAGGEGENPLQTWVCLPPPNYTFRVINMSSRLKTHFISVCSVLFYLIHSHDWRIYDVFYPLVFSMLAHAKQRIIRTYIRRLLSISMLAHAKQRIIRTHIRRLLSTSMLAHAKQRIIRTYIRRFLSINMLEHAKQRNIRLIP